MWVEVYMVASLFATLWLIWDSKRDEVLIRARNFLAIGALQVVQSILFIAVAAPSQQTIITGTSDTFTVSQSPNLVVLSTLSEFHGLLFLIGIVTVGFMVLTSYLAKTASLNLEGG